MKLTDSGTLIRLAYQGLLDMKIDADEILFRAGFDKSKLYEINLRTPFSAQPLFWKSAIEISGDPAIGLHLGESMPIYKGQILEYLICPMYQQRYDGTKSIFLTLLLSPCLEHLLS